MLEPIFKKEHYLPVPSKSPGKIFIKTVRPTTFPTVALSPPKC